MFGAGSLHKGCDGGGLGHLGVQYAAALGYRVIAIGRGGEKARLATQLGAEEYIDSAATHPGRAL